MSDYEDYEPEDGGYEGEAPEVYRRRRIIAIIIALLVIILVIWGLVFAAKKIVGAGDSGAAAASSSSADDNFESFSARPSESDSDSASASDGASDGASDQASDGASASTSEKPSDDASDSSASPSPTAAAEGKSSTPAAAPSSPKAVEACSPANLQVAASVDQGSYAAGQNPVLTAKLNNTSGDPCTVDVGAQNITYNITSGSAQVFDSRTCPSGAAKQEVQVAADGEQTTQITWPRTINSVGCGAAARDAQPGYYWLTVEVNGVTSEKKPILLK